MSGDLISNFCLMGFYNEDSLKEISILSNGNLNANNNNSNNNEDGELNEEININNLLKNIETKFGKIFYNILLWF